MCTVFVERTCTLTNLTAEIKWTIFCQSPTIVFTLSIALSYAGMGFMCFVVLLLHGCITSLVDFFFLIFHIKSALLEVWLVSSI